MRGKNENKNKCKKSNNKVKRNKLRGRVLGDTSQLRNNSLYVSHFV
jgi:hypothetical protein